MSAELSLTNRVRLAVIERAMETGHVPEASEVASGLGLDRAAVLDAFRALGEGHVYVLDPSDPNRLRMANPFSAVPSNFEVTVRGRWYFGNCVWDALGIVSLLGGEGTVETSCPDCGEKLTLRVEGGKLAKSAGIVHFSVPARKWWDDIVFT